MATITSAGSGLWSAGATWVGGVAPVDNDAVVIAAGHVVEFDVDQSGFANGIDGITITGTLKLTRTAGTYYMKIKAAKTIGGAGVFDCGASAMDSIPFAAKHTITGGAGWYINGASGLAMTVFAAEPAIKYALLSGMEAIGQTRIEIDRDVTGDIWAVGDTIHITDLSAAYCEVKTIGAISAGYIDVTVGLTAVKATGAYMVLVTRNVTFIGTSAQYIYKSFASGKLIIAGGNSSTTYANNGYLFGSCVGVIISGGTFSDYWNTRNTLFNISGGVFTHAKGDGGLSLTGSLISDCLVVGNTTGANLIGCLVTGGIFSKNYFNVVSSGCSIFGGTITGAANAGLTGNAVVKNLVMGANPVDLSAFYGTLFNTALGSSVECAGYTSNSKSVIVESFDHDQVAGAYKAWVAGGVTSSQAVTVPTGLTQAMQTVLENAEVEGYWQREYTIGAGASINFAMHLRKTASMAYLPRCIIFNKAAADPFAGGAGLHTFTMTNSVDTWESESWTFTNSTAADVTLVVRFQGMAASGSMYSALVAEQINVDMTAALAKLVAIQAKTDNLPSDPADQSLLMAAIGSITVDNAAIAAAVMGSLVEGTITLAQAQRLMLAVLAGKASGGGTTTITFRDTGDTVDRVVATVDANGNRSAVTLDGE